MQKADPQHGHVQQPAAKQAKAVSVESPQLEKQGGQAAMMGSGPQSQKLAGLAAMMNNSPAMAAQRKLFDSIHSSPRYIAQKQKLDSLFSVTRLVMEKEPLQGKFVSESPAQLEQQPAPKPNNTGLPDNLKSGIENLSGMSMDNVKVHYNSSQPAQLNAIAYAQDTDIHVAPGQEKHLPHEAWHVVQQAQGRVQPTMQMKAGVPVNDDKELEYEADVMGGRAKITQPMGSGGGREGRLNLLASHKSIVSLMPPPQATGNNVQRAYKFKNQEWKDEDRAFQDYQFKEEGDHGKFTAVQADAGLPTPYGVLKATFGDKLNDSFFKKTAKLGDTCDRPHRVSATITRKDKKNDRESTDADIVSAIGNLGSEELSLRDGENTKREIRYHGGHLVGYQILAGAASNTPWNVAPQDADNNQFAYNNTIEKMLRKADVDTTYNYTVEVAYQSLNYRVNQDLLKKHGVINGVDKSKYWELQIPSRIPLHWQATATMLNDGKFSTPSSSNGTTYDQLSQDMESELDHKDKTHTARYKLGYKDKNKKKLEHVDVKKDATDVNQISFEMHQIQPSNLPSSDIPNDWKYKNNANFGDVTEEKVSKEKLEILLGELEALVKKLNDEDIDEYSDEINDGFDFKAFFGEVFIPNEKAMSSSQISKLNHIVECNIKSQWNNEFQKIKQDIKQDVVKLNNFKSASQQMSGDMNAKKTELSSTENQKKLQVLKRKFMDEKTEIELGCTLNQEIRLKKKKLNHISDDYKKCLKKTSEQSITRTNPRALKKVAGRGYAQKNFGAVLKCIEKELFK